MVSHEFYAILHDAVDNDVFVILSRFCLVDYLFCLQQLLHKRVKGTLYIFFVNPRCQPSFCKMSVCDPGF